jgi:hypothetical protein
VSPRGAAHFAQARGKRKRRDGTSRFGDIERAANQAAATARCALARIGSVPTIILAMHGRDMPMTAARHS